MQDYSASDWPSMARANGLDSFEAVWALDIGWFEEPNVRRGGWSGVSRLEVTCTDGRSEAIFIKRQENHETFSWRHPLKGVTTFRREFQNLMLLQSFDVPTLEVLYFAERNVGNDRRAILVSRELTGYSSLEDCMAYWQQHGFPEKAVWQETIQRIATVARHMHQHRMQQNCFLPKHIFIGERHGQMDVRLIDMEKAKRRWTKERALVRDLDTFNRRSAGIRTADRLRFLLAYHEVDRSNARVRKTWNKLVALLRRKSRNLLHTQ
ncbi:MAG: lipopolysaccharide kinase InaA family protein [Pseudomonadota bacterium]